MVFIPFYVDQNPNRLSSFRNSLRSRLRSSFRQRPSQQRKSCIALGQNGKPAAAMCRQTETSIRVQLNSVSQIDRVSRVIFPLFFSLLNFIYWIIYLQAERNIDKQLVG